LPSPATPSPDTLLSRFIDESSRLKRDSGTGGDRTVWKTFQPDRTRNETSVYDVDNMTDSELWTLGDTEVGAARGRPIIGRAELTVHQASYDVLYVERDGPPRHAAIRGWPAHDGPDAWGRMRALAAELAARATVIRR